MVKLQIKYGEPGARHLKIITDCLSKDGLIIYPTDTVYALGCSVLSKSALDRLMRLKKQQNSQTLPTVICKDISQVSEYAKLTDNKLFKIIKRNTPGPFTFILPIGDGVPKLLKKSRKTIGVRIPDHPMPRAIIENLGHPILSSSVKSEDEMMEYFIDPDEIEKHYGNLVEVIIDNGDGAFHPSTIVDLSKDEIEIVREGLGELIF